MRTSGFLVQRRLRRILHLAGYRISIGRPAPGDLVAVWGHSRHAARGERLAARHGAGLLRVEDAFLRSLFPGRAYTGAKDAPIGLTITRQGCHFDASCPSDLETLLREHPLDDPALLTRAEGLIARMKEAHLTKYAAVDPGLPLPEPGYVLVVDQVRGDASVRLGSADAETFRRMLAAARAEHPDRHILIRTHPETAQNLRKGHFTEADTAPGVTLFTAAASPWDMLEKAHAVYTVSSQLGFEAILAGHRPETFGIPFYAGWGLSNDRHPDMPDRRPRQLSSVQLAAAALLLYPTWYDPLRDRLCPAEDAAEALATRARAWREDHEGWSGENIRLWKRGHFQRFFGRYRRLTFTAAKGRKTLHWGATQEDQQVTRVEDGLLRSRGLGAQLVPPLSLVLDDLGIYYDPTQESRFERLVAQRIHLRPDQETRARGLIRKLKELGLSKYNIGGAPVPLPDGHRILVPGQVEDDASVQLGAGALRTNAALLRHVRQQNPGAILLYKPHPDVEAGLRPGALTDEGFADLVLRDTDPALLLDQVDEVWTMTSGLGFEALVRGIPVTTTGRPFYAGWGLTRDLGEAMPRRAAKHGTVTLEGLVHAMLIDYPRYLDPVSGQPCTVEVAVERLESGKTGRPRPGLRMLAKAQGLFASWPGLWR
ncbi:capsular polysaccharide biosynthesis protein [Pseudooceanicola sp. HF7]|uniref:capsular polysaccharide biosynthesis protein n=1 Tax=Pseudooceanicola sp. HF7 TaxID=2721560 RepID=UPI0034C603A3